MKAELGASPSPKTLLCTILLGLWCCISVAGPTAAPVRAEIDALLAALETSGCQFNRNGSWHGAAEVKPHLIRKLEYIERRGTIQSTEQFIELAASRSSTSGKPYQVRCGSQAAVTSQQWLTARLAALRGAKKP
jgi:hypothetical protein